MILAGIILLVLGILLGVHILFILGLVALVVGLILLAAGSVGHPLGPRNHYW